MLSPIFLITCDSAGCASSDKVAILTDPQTGEQDLQFMGEGSPDWQELSQGRHLCPECAEKLKAAQAATLPQNRKRLNQKLATQAPQPSPAQYLQPPPMPQMPTHAVSHRPAQTPPIAQGAQAPVSVPFNAGHSWPAQVIPVSGQNGPIAAPVVAPPPLPEAVPVPLEQIPPEVRAMFQNFQNPAVKK